jgi:uncharacterized membrane protein YuzA (DUF378 family)
MVHLTYKLFLALYLAHLLADFVFQTDSVVTTKKEGRWRSYLLHGTTHYATTLAIVAAMNPGLVVTWIFERVVLALCLVHLLLDWAKFALAHRRWIPDNVWSFTADQAAHLATVAGATLLITRAPWQSVVPYLQKIRLGQDKILLVAVIYVVVVFCGGYFIRFLIQPLWKEKPGKHTQEHDEVVNAGLYIGWLERFLALTAVFLQSPGTVGLILAAKSIARYPELKPPGRFVEYFLIGTLLSISIAIAGGIILLKVFDGTVSLGK